MTFIFNFIILYFLLTFALCKPTVPSTNSIPNRFDINKNFLSVPYPFILAGSAALIEAYSNLPQKNVHGSNPPPLPPRKYQDSALILFPGSGGPDEYTNQLINRIKSEDNRLGVNRFVTMYDWKRWRGNFLRAAFDSTAVGKLIGTQLAKEETKDKKLRSLHFIGISVGSFAADTCCNVYRSEAMKMGLSPAHITLTLLDPFTSKGIFRNNYGFTNFGLSADYCEMYLNSDDPVPFTNNPLPNAFTYELTRAQERESFVPSGKNSLHCWPVAYLANHWSTDIGPDGILLLPKHNDKRPRGAVFNVP